MEIQSEKPSHAKMDSHTTIELPGEVPSSRLRQCREFIGNQALKTTPVALIFGLSFGVLQPVYTELIKNRVCELVLGYPKSYCEHYDEFSGDRARVDAVRKTASEYILYRSLVMSLPPVVLSQFIGQWSDKYGRKVPMMLPFVGMFICAVILLFCGYYPLHPGIMILASLIAASFGGMMMFPLALFAYIGDYANDSNRTVIMGIVTGVQAIGTTIGLLTGGMLLQRFGFIPPFYLVCVLHVAGFLYVLFFVKDIVKFPMPLQFRLRTFRELFVLTNLWDNVNTLRRKRENNGRFHFALLIITVLISATCIDGEPQIFQLFVEFEPLSWNVQDFSLFSAVQGAISGLLMPILFILFKRNLGMKDSTIGIVSVLSGIICAFGFALSTAAWMVFASAGLGVIRTLHAVAAKSLLTGGVEKHEIGKIMAITSSVQAFAPTLTGGIFLNIFGASAGWWSGLCFAVAAYALLFSLGTFCYIDVDNRRQGRKNTVCFFCCSLK